MLSMGCRLALESTGLGTGCAVLALGSGLAGRPPNRPVAKPVKGCEIHLLCLLALLCLFICFQKAPRRPPGFGKAVWGAQEGSMRAPDGSGEAPAELPGGCEMLIFIGFYNVFMISTHLASWLMLLALGGADFLPTCGV